MKRNDRVEILDYVLEKKVPDRLKNNKRRYFIQAAKKFGYKDGMLFYKSNKGIRRFYFNCEDRQKRAIVEATHNAAHFGTKRRTNWYVKLIMVLLENW